MESGIKKNKLKINNNDKYYGTYLIYDVANSCLAALRAKVPSTQFISHKTSLSPIHIQNSRKYFKQNN